MVSITNLKKNHEIMVTGRLALCLYFITLLHNQHHKEKWLSRTFTINWLINNIHLKIVGFRNKNVKISA